MNNPDITEILNEGKTGNDRGIYLGRPEEGETEVVYEYQASYFGRPVYVKREITKS